MCNDVQFRDAMLLKTCTHDTRASQRIVQLGGCRGLWSELMVVERAAALGYLHFITATAHNRQLVVP